MNWEQLLSLKRYGDTEKRARKEQDENRLGFEVDYDRIIFSSAFRSLQDKTQVIPLSKTDFVHTRLTHSLEVSVVARSLGRIVGKQIIAKYPELSTDLGYKATDFGAITATAALAHDIGNPPFGHSGEKAIGEFFKTGKGVEFKSQLTPKQYQDLVSFEGNANGFRILSNTEEALRLSYATLGAFMKYPKESLPVKPTTHIADKKYGFFQEQKEMFYDVATSIGLTQTRTGAFSSFSRHPLTFLVEAADDICYTIIDFEDGINLGLINEEFALEYLIKLVKHTIDIKKYQGLKTTKTRVAYLRALAISTLINEAAIVFMNNETEILSGNFDRGLLDRCAYEPQITDIIKMSVENVYQSKEVVEKELIGYQVLSKLLEVYITAVNNKTIGKQTNYDKLVLKTLPADTSFFSEDLYIRLLSVSSYVASLTDSNALLRYRKLMGMVF